jgi:hypothetical protein
MDYNLKDDDDPCEPMTYSLLFSYGGGGGDNEGTELPNLEHEEYKRCCQK